MGIFSNAKGQLTPQSLVESGTNSNSFEVLWLSSLPARMKKIRSKMKALECVCGTVSSMLSDLETKSLGLNTLGTT